MDQLEKISETSTQWNYEPLPAPVKISEQNWPEGTRPLVSICCITYNHINFIRDAIEGFLLQETTFPVEILIHDDASHDGTAEIVKKYSEHYPFLIRPTFQVENQYSKGVQVELINLTLASGGLMALCHGDDYWCEPQKLQCQEAFMKEKGVGICGHPAKVINENGDHLGYLTGSLVRYPSVYLANKLLWHSGNMLPYPSIMITRDVRDEMVEHMPPVRFHTGIQILGAKCSGFGILPFSYTTYRVDVTGSTSQLILGNAEKKKKTAELRLESIKYLKLLYNKGFVLAFSYLIASQYRIIYSGNLLKMMTRCLCDKGRVLDRTLRVLFLCSLLVVSALKKAFKSLSRVKVFRSS